MKELFTPFRNWRVIVLAVLVKEVADLTKRSEVTVRMWLSGQQTPDRLAQEIIAQHYGVDVDTLFS